MHMGWFVVSALIVASSVFAQASAVRCLNSYYKANPPNLAEFEIVMMTGNHYKRAQYKRVLGSALYELTGKKLRFRKPLNESEPQTFHAKVANFKASQTPQKEGTIFIVEDGALHFKNKEVDIGVNLKTRYRELEKLAGEKATWRVMIGYQYKGKVYLYKGEVPGEIVHKGAHDYHFVPWFRPNGFNRPLSEIDRIQHPEAYAPERAMRALLEGRVDRVVTPLKEWNGEWQPE